MTESIDPVGKYVEDVLNKTIVAGPHVRAACRRHLRDMKSSKLAVWNFYFDPAAAREWIEWIVKHCYLEQDVPFPILEWQKFVAGSLGGWLRKDTRTRRFRVAYIETAKGSGKTPFAAAIALKLFAADQEDRAEIYIGAATKDQAGIGFADAVSLVRNSPTLSRRVTFNGGEGREWGMRLKPKNEGNLRTFKKLAFDTAQSGYRPSCAVMDELHEHPDDTLIKMMRKGFKSRRQPLLLAITNTGEDEYGTCYEYHLRGVSAVNGDTEDDEFFAYICALDEDDDPLTDPKCWPKTNPGLPHIPGVEYIESEIKEAKGLPSELSDLLRLQFCVWNEGAEGWISSDLWRGTEGDHKLENFEGWECFLGLDLAHVEDFCALAIVFRRRVEVIVAEQKVEKWEYVLFVEYFTCDRDLIARSKRDRGAYPKWALDGHITVIPKPAQVIDYAFIAKRIKEIEDQFHPLALAYDEYAFRELEADMQEIGVSTPMVCHPQGFSWSIAKRAEAKDQKPSDDPLLDLSMPSSIREMEAAIKENRLKSAKSPMTRFNVQSVKVRHDANGNKTFMKRDSRKRIDGMVAGAMAIGAAKARPKRVERGSYLENSEEMDGF